MENFIFTEFEILETNFDQETKLVQSVVARSHSPLIPISHDYTFTRADLLLHFRGDEKIYIQAGEDRVYLDLVEVDGKKRIAGLELV